MRAKNRKVQLVKKGVHLHSGSGRYLSYPREVDEEILEWVLVRRDLHLPVGTKIIKARARQLIKPHNSRFLASNGWLDKFKLRHGLSLRCRTSISQKLPAQLKKKIRAEHN